MSIFITDASNFLRQLYSYVIGQMFLKTLFIVLVIVLGIIVLYNILKSAIANGLKKANREGNLNIKGRPLLPDNSAQSVNNKAVTDAIKAGIIAGVAESRREGEYNKELFETELSEKIKDIMGQTIHDMIVQKRANQER